MEHDCDAASNSGQERHQSIPEEGFQTKNELSWKSFDEFKKDLGQVCFVEHVYFSEDQNDTDMWAGIV